MYTYGVALEFLTPKTLLTILHLFGLALGMGAALVSDAIFFHSTKDKKIIKTELGILDLGSKLVWLGLFILLISGLGLLITNLDVLLYSSKFWAKMTIVLTLSLNGLFFHHLHLPWIKATKGKKLNSFTSFKQKRSWLLVGGAISSVSWFSALVLGSLRNIGLSYGVIIGFYALLLIAATTFALVFRNFILPSK